MPILEEVIPNKKIVLPASSKPDDEAWVEVAQGANMDLVDGLTDDETQSKVALAAIVLSRIIKAWNFTDKTGNIASITPENIRKLPLTDIAYISEQSGLNDAFKPLSTQKKSD